MGDKNIDFIKEIQSTGMVGNTYNDVSVTPVEKDKYKVLKKEFTRYKNNMEHQLHILYVEIKNQLFSVDSDIDMYERKGWNKLPDYVESYRQLQLRKYGLETLMSIVHLQ